MHAVDLAVAWLQSLPSFASFSRPNTLKHYDSNSVLCSENRGIRIFSFWIFGKFYHSVISSGNTGITGSVIITLGNKVCSIAAVRVASFIILSLNPVTSYPFPRAESLAHWVLIYREWDILTHCPPRASLLVLALWSPPVARHVFQHNYMIMPSAPRLTWDSRY